MLLQTAGVGKSSDLRLYNLGFCELSMNIAGKSVMIGCRQTSMFKGLILSLVTRRVSEGLSN